MFCRAIVFDSVDLLTPTARCLGTKISATIYDGEGLMVTGPNAAGACKCMHNQPFCILFCNLSFKICVSEACLGKSFSLFHPGMCGKQPLLLLITLAFP